MGDVIRADFNRPRKFTGLIPDEIGQMALEYAEQQRRARDLVLFARQGAPPPIPFTPDDCA